MTVSGVIAGINPRWDEELTGGGGRALRRGGRPGPGHPRARDAPAPRPTGAALDLVRAAIERAADPRVIELDRKVPWHETVVTTAPDALYVVYPKSDGWGMQAVPDALAPSRTAGTCPRPGAGLADASWPR